MKIIIAFLIPAVFSLMTNRDAWEGDQAIPQRIWDHRGSVMAVAFTPDGIQVVTGGAAQTDSVVFWDLKTGQRLHRLQDAGLVYSLALSSDGKKIVTGGMIGIGVNPQAKMAVWDAVTGKELFTLKVGNPGPQPCVAFSPDGKFVATGTVTSAAEKSVGSVQLWDANTGKEAGLFLGLSEGFSQLQFSPDGRTLAAASWGAQTHVVLWEVATRKQRGVLKISKSWSLIRSLAFSADGKLLAWVTGNPVEGAVEHVLWDLTTLRRIAPLRSDELMSFVTFSRTGKSLISVEMEGNFQLWDLATCKKTAGFEVNLDFPTLAHAAAVSPDGTTLVIGTGTPGVLAPPSPTVGTVRIFDVATGRERLSPEKEKQRAKNEAAETARLAAAAKAEALRKQKQAKLEPALQAQVEQSARAALLLQYAVHLNQAQQAIERGQFAVAKKLLQAYLPKAKEHDLRGFEWHFLWRQCQYSLTPLEHQEKVCDGFRGAHPLLSADGKTLAVETEDHAVTLWDMESGKRRVILQGATGPIHNFVFSPNGKLLVTAGGAYPSALHPVYRINQEVPPFVRRGIVWEVNSGKRLADFEVTKKLNTCGAFSPDSKMLAIGDEDGTIYLWEISSQKVRSSLAGKQLPAAMTFSPDGAMLAVGGLNGALCLWDVTTGKETLLDTNNAKQQINSLLFSSDGKNLYSTEGAWSNDYVAKRWKSDDKEKWALQHEWKLVSRIALSPDCKRLALSGWHGVALWDVVEDREVARLLPRVSGDGFVSLLAFSPDSKLLLVQADAIRGQPQLALFDASSGARVGLAHDLLSGTPVRIIVENGGKITALALGGPKGFPDAVDVLRTALGEITRGRIFAVEGPHGIPALAFSPDGFRLALTDGQRVFRWDLRTDKRQEVYKSNNMPFRHVRFSADGKTLLATHPPGIKLLDPGTGKERAAIEAYYGTIGASGRYVFVTPDNLTISAYSATTGKKTATLAAKKGKTEVGRSPFNDIVIESPGGKWVVGLGAVLFEANTQKEIHHWQTQPKPLQFAFTPDEKTLVTTDSKGTMIVWELPSLRQRHVAPKTWAPTGLSAISSDNRTAALMQDAGTMVLFDLVEGVALARVIGFSAPVARMAFSPDGKSLVTGCTDGTIQFWCPVTGAQRLNVPAHFGSVTVLAFSPNGAILATGGGQTVRLWLARE